jgi:predicted nucleotidyltransferase
MIGGREDMVQDKNLQSILDKLSVSLEGIYGDKLKSVILYGSVARGENSPESDIDIMVLVDLPSDQLKEYEDRLCDVSTEFALEYFKVFSIIDVSYEEFTVWKNVLPFYRNVENEGVILYVA